MIPKCKCHWLVAILLTWMVVGQGCKIFEGGYDIYIQGHKFPPNHPPPQDIDYHNIPHEPFNGHVNRY